MSRITYCSLEEAWGDSFNRKDINEQQSSIKVNNNLKNGQQIKNNQQIYERNKYDKLIENSEDNRAELINNINKIERNYLTENNNQTSLIEYNKYRINPKNQVNSYQEPQYTPFQETLDKKYLQDKLNYLENEFIKYKNLVNDNNNIEHFDNTNKNTNDNSKDNDIIDLIVLIIIGLLVIFVLNSIFNIGKAIGARNKV
jgi:hypothetical protein